MKRAVDKKRDMEEIETIEIVEKMLEDKKHIKDGTWSSK
jgi:hypothetical protein